MASIRPMLDPREMGGSIERIAAKIGISVSKRLVGRGIARWIPVIGALGVGAYAYYDTGQVARTAMTLFAAEAAEAAASRLAHARKSRD